MVAVDFSMDPLVVEVEEVIRTHNTEEVAGGMHNMDRGTWDLHKDTCMALGVVEDMDTFRDN